MGLPESESFRITTSGISSETFACGAALNPSPKNFLLAIIIHMVILARSFSRPPSKEILHGLLSYVCVVIIMPIRRETNRFLSSFLTFFYLAMISAPTPISAASRKTRVVRIERSAAFVTVVSMMSILTMICCRNLPQYSAKSLG
ncbi:MAG TPA: hypothetical protein VE622_00625 [Nitrososphaeraceae archaeon]|nr:hypothetical protein [Nitrososphaeraceae archaeon]